MTPERAEKNLQETFECLDRIGSAAEVIQNFVKKIEGLLADSAVTTLSIAKGAITNEIQNIKGLIYEKSDSPTKKSYALCYHSEVVGVSENLDSLVRTLASRIGKGDLDISLMTRSDSHGTCWTYGVYSIQETRQL